MEGQSGERRGRSEHDLGCHSDFVCRDDFGKRNVPDMPNMVQSQYLFPIPILPFRDLPVPPISFVRQENNCGQTQCEQLQKSDTVM